MSSAPTTGDDPDAALVRALAEAFDLTIRPDHLGEVVAAWRLMRPHLERVRSAELPATAEPAALFRP